MTRLPSAAPIFEYKGKLYEGRPYCTGQTPDGVDQFDETLITLLDGDPYGLPSIHGGMHGDEPGLRPRTKAARELAAHALAAQDERVDAEIADFEAMIDIRDNPDRFVKNMCKAFASIGQIAAPHVVRL